MKKLIALALALVMVLGLAVSASAKIVLDVEDTDDVEATEIKELKLKDGTALLRADKAGTYFVEVETDNVKEGTLNVETAGAVSAELVTFDGSDETVEYIASRRNTFGWLLERSCYGVAVLKEVRDHLAKGAVVYKNAMGHRYEVASKAEWKKGNFGCTYEEAEDILDYLEEKYEDGKYAIVDNGKLPTLLKITVPENYTAAYKEGTITVTATSTAKKAISYKITVITDIVIYGYEDVKDAAKYGIELDPDHDKGYSDYMSAKNGYQTPELVLDMRKPEVVSTTAFRAIKGKDLTVVGSEYATVTIKSVAAGQKGVNFRFEVDESYDDDNAKHTDFQFGFKGNQVINSEFVIKMELDTTWFMLREAFKQKLEEEDIVTYYILKDGKLANTAVVDYGKETLTIDGKTEEIDVKDGIELTINGKAGDTLGWYTVQLTAPAAEESEENPNTGAETVVGATVALAVVAMASAAAVSLKK